MSRPPLYLNGLTCISCGRGWYEGYSSDGKFTLPCSVCGDVQPSKMNHKKFEQLITKRDKMSSLLKEIADEHHDFEKWCSKKGYTRPPREFTRSPHYKEYSDYIDPPSDRIKRAELHQQRLIKESKKVGVLPVESWYDGEQTNKKCSKCGAVGLLRKWGFLVTDEYGCPVCGFTEGGEW